MLGNLVGIENTNLSQFLMKEDVNFLVNISKKISKVNIELNKLEIKKEEIIKEIVNQNASSSPKNKREYANNSETALESVNIISKNLYNLSNSYDTINQLNNFIAIRCDENLSGYDYMEDINKLSEKIKSTEYLEEKIKDDNKKNELIIKSFLNKEDLDIAYKDDETYDVGDLNTDGLKDNLVLKICEKRVELPYTKREIEEFMREYPNDYKKPQDVINKEFVSHISIYKKHPILSRFKETYYLCRTKEMMSIFESFSYAKSIMFRSEINSYIIAAVKSKKQLEDYIECMENNKLDEYKHFKIVYEINPTISF